MAEYLDVLVVLPAETPGGKDSWNRIGVAWPNKIGGFNVQVWGWPAPVNQRFRFVIRPPYDRDSDVRSFQPRPSPQLEDRDRRDEGWG